MGKEDRHTKYHNQGQEDASKGEYDPPHTWLQEVLGRDELLHDNNAYREGYRNGKK